ncbi:PREDICTED: uncharacterized protein LOC108770781 isoform X2 [Trachymyrmex cornetzi]|uniref:uncharacterized protein LOC108770781 isoform X2 n=1 Tax=Trachymyrmex cornetzi TaxID=471704 RepID=UPI00084ED3A1|nr:PREDICTED: uncharacterized protein LOC108770781 isoform X2 [Trachymyrmex cornetzi]
MLKKCGYCGLILADDTLLWHKCFKKFNEETHAVQIGEDGVVILIHKSQIVHQQDKVLDAEMNNCEDNDAIVSESLQSQDELLISIMFGKRALWDSNIPAKERSKLKKNDQWQEVYNLMGGVLNIKELKDRWRYLRDRFVKAHRAHTQYTPSGSAANSKTIPKFAHYQQMLFLTNTVTHAPTCTSLPTTETARNEKEGECDIALNVDTVDAMESLTSPPIRSDLSSSASSSAQMSNCCRRNTSKKKRLSSSVETEFHESVLAALREPTEPVKQNDGVDGFTTLLGEGLRKLPYSRRARLQIKFLTMLADETELLEEETNQFQ